MLIYLENVFILEFFAIPYYLLGMNMPWIGYGFQV